MSLMDDPEVWNMDKINEILKSGETTTITLPKPINIYLSHVLVLFIVLVVPISIATFGTYGAKAVWPVSFVVQAQFW